MESAVISSDGTISPVKRLITLYNTNGAAAHKASRRKKKDGAESLGKCESLSSPESMAGSRESSPRNGNDDDNRWSSDECSVEKLDNQSPIISPSKPSDISRSSSDMNEICWEVWDFCSFYSFWQTTVTICLLALSR